MASAAGRGASTSSLSPLVQSYHSQFDFNRPYGPGLPRPDQIFTSGSFAPLMPVSPMPIDVPREDSGRPAPRRWQYPVGWNLPVGQPGTEGLKMATFATLRALADMYSVVRACIDKRVSEIVALEWDIVPTSESDQAMRGDSDKRTEWEKRRAQVIEFFNTPDSDRAKFPTFSAWLTAVLEDLFVLDAVAIHLHPPRRPNSGPFHSNLASLDVLDGSTIRPLLNMHGSTPRPPNVAYQQYIWGVPRVDLTSIIQGLDIDGMSDKLVAEYRADQLFYLRFKPRNWTPYGYSCVEQVLLPITIGLARQQYQWDYFQDGSIPGQFVTPGESVSTPKQIRDLQDALNGMAGDIGAKHRIVVLPPGSKADPQKAADLSDQFDEWILSQVTMGFELTPMDLGITPRARAMQSPEGSRQMAMVNQSNGNTTRLKPVINWLKTVLFDYVIQQVFGQTDMEWTWGITSAGESAQDELQMQVQRLQNGISSVDEVRMDLGQTPWGLPESNVPLIWTGTGPVLLSKVGETPAAPGAALPPGAHPAPKTPSDVRQEQQDKLEQDRQNAKDDQEGTPSHQAAVHLPAATRDHPDPVAEVREETKALDAELAKLGRYLRKGKRLEEFTSDILTKAQLAQGQAAQQEAQQAQQSPQQSHAAAIAAIGAAALAAMAIAHRDKALNKTANTVADNIGTLVHRYRNGDVSYPAAVDQGVKIMTDGYRQAMQAGTDHAAHALDLPPIAVDLSADQRGETQRGYVTRILSAGMTSDPQHLEAMASRFDLYGSTLTGAYNAAYGATVIHHDPQARIIWRLGETEHCPECLARDGKSFTAETLPGWPGDGEFGGVICKGGPNCGCWLEFVQGDRTVDIGTNTQRPDSVSYYQSQQALIQAQRDRADAARREFLAGIPGPAAARAAGRDTVRQQLAAVANHIIQNTGGYPGITVRPEDIPASIVAELTRKGEDPGLVAYEASLVASVPQPEWELLVKWDPDAHPRGPDGRFIRFSDMIHEEARQANQRHRDRGRVLQSAFDDPARDRQEADHLQHLRQGLTPTEVVEHATSPVPGHGRLTELRRKQFASGAALADATRRTHAYTDHQINLAFDKMNRMRDEIDTEEARKRREKMLISVGGIVAGFLMAVFAPAVLALAPVALAAAANFLPDAVKTAVEYKRRA